MKEEEDTLEMENREEGRVRQPCQGPLVLVLRRRLQCIVDPLSAAVCITLPLRIGHVDPFSQRPMRPSMEAQHEP